MTAVPRPSAFTLECAEGLQLKTLKSMAGCICRIKGIKPFCDTIYDCKLIVNAEVNKMTVSNDDIVKRRKDGWIEVWFVFEALGIDKDAVGSALKLHTEKLSRIKDLLVYETSFKEIAEAKNLPQGISAEKAWSQVADVKFFAKDIPMLMDIIMVYGPSSVEILGPLKKEIKIDELQSTANTLAGLVHEFAARGVGGILVSSEPKRVG
jgi:hypothetical protein